MDYGIIKRVFRAGLALQEYAFLTSRQLLMP